MRNRAAWELDQCQWVGREMAVLMLDLDYFKGINDTYGHAMGDAVLKQVGQILRSAVRRTDRVYRYGGEEFVVILPQIDLRVAYERAEQIRLSIAQNVKVCDETVTCSIGIAHGIDIKSTFLIADQALYQAKKSGRNTIRKA